MKKLTIFLLLTTIAHFSFSIPNIKLYEGGKLKYTIKNNQIFTPDDCHLYTIKDGKLYYAPLNPEDDMDPSSKKIIEKDDSIMIIDEYLGDMFLYSETYSKKNGMLILSQHGSYIYEYDENTGVPIKESFYKNETLQFYKTNSWKGHQLQSSIYYLADGEIEQKIDYTYDSETKKRIKEIYSDGNGNITCLIENDPQTEKIVKKYEYNQDKILKSLTLYKNELPAEKIFFTNGIKEDIKKIFISLPDDTEYYLNDDFYITSSNYTCYSTVTECEETKLSKVIDWDDGHVASFKKYAFTNNDKAYNPIQKLKEKDLLIPSSYIELHKKNSDSFFYFDVKDDEIDLSSCYKIEISKKTNKFFAAMNKSGKNSGPFGFDIGMTYEEVKAACGGRELKHISGDCYQVSPQKKHPLFEEYTVWISREYGLYYVKGLTRDINTNKYGTEIKNRFADILDALETKYGNFRIIDTIDKDYIFSDEQYWMTALKDGARTYRASWYTLKPEDYNGLESIGLGIKCSNKYSSDEAFIWLEYGFTNNDIAQEALDDVL